MIKKMMLALLAFTAVQVACVYLLLGRNERKIVYADAIRLFNGYQFKTDMENAGKGTLIRLKNELDSVEMVFKTSAQNPALQQLMAEKQQSLTMSYDAINKEINQKVWERLNPLIHQFGEDRHIDLMIGANGMGTVLYASQARDITDDLIKYANQHYEKGN